MLELDGGIQTIYGWYDVCSPLLATMAVKMPSTYSEADRNWQWPEKTWFQERLNSIKAREQEQRRKPRSDESSVMGSGLEAKPDTLKVD